MRIGEEYNQTLNQTKGSTLTGLRSDVDTLFNRSLPSLVYENHQSHLPLGEYSAHVIQAAWATQTPFCLHSYAVVCDIALSLIDHAGFLLCDLSLTSPTHNCDMLVS